MDTVLIANRGEIAVRIIRACRKMGLSTVAVCSEADMDSMHAQMADHTACIGPKSLKKSYLNINALLAVARAYKARYVHPGVGFLSENMDFRRACREQGLIFIGPEASVMEALSDKLAVKNRLSGLGIPVIPGGTEPVRSVPEGLAVAREIGFPVLLKAAFGGGGMGIRRVDDECRFEELFNMVRAEAAAAFGSGEVYLEKLVLNARHIEVQVLADNFGNALSFGTRECSLQRRSQKLLEEAPACNLDRNIMRALQDTAIRIVQETGYTNAGTVEYLVDENGNYYFIEMNTRIQVEHPATEAVTGVDLIQAQIMAAMGCNISIRQEDLAPKGHAIECRINAENPLTGFTPSPGRIEGLHMPGGMGIRVDSSVRPGDTIYPFYDSLVMKIIAHAEDRSACIRVMDQALSELRIDGISHNAQMHRELLKSPDFVQGRVYTKWIEEKFLPVYLKERV